MRVWGEVGAAGGCWGSREALELLSGSCEDLVVGALLFRGSRKLCECLGGVGGSLLEGNPGVFVWGVLGGGRGSLPAVPGLAQPRLPGSTGLMRSGLALGDPPGAQGGAGVSGGPGTALWERSLPGDPYSAWGPVGDWGVAGGVPGRRSPPNSPSRSLRPSRAHPIPPSPPHLERLRGGREQDGAGQGARSGAGSGVGSGWEWGSARLCPRHRLPSLPEGARGPSALSQSSKVRSMHPKVSQNVPKSSHCTPEESPLVTKYPAHPKVALFCPKVPLLHPQRIVLSTKVSRCAPRFAPCIPNSPFPIHNCVPMCPKVSQ